MPYEARCPHHAEWVLPLPTTDDQNGGTDRHRDIWRQGCALGAQCPSKSESYYFVCSLAQPHEQGLTKCIHGPIWLSLVLSLYQSWPPCHTLLLASNLISHSQDTQVRKVEICIVGAGEGLTNTGGQVWERTPIAWLSLSWEPTWIGRGRRGVGSETGERRVKGERKRGKWSKKKREKSGGEKRRERKEEG